MSYRYGDIVVPFVSPDEPLAVQDRHFLDCIRNGTRPLTDGASGLAVVEALEAAERSRRLGRPVLLEELRVDGRVTVPSGGHYGPVPAPAPLAAASARTVMDPGAR
jgi:hypothetical protein